MMDRIAMIALVLAAIPLFAQAKEATAQYDTPIYCASIVRAATNDMQAQGRPISPRLTAFRAVLLGAQMRAIRERASAAPDARGRGAAEINADAQAVRAQGEAALHAEVRRCWQLTDGSLAPDDLL
ncbi:MAG TPA: hypothetical protein PKY87_13185 [Terricaulis sp.]|nr:hypothetical protein [Terricaulis sp.]